MREISEREEQLPEAVIGKIMKLATERRDIISLGPGEPDFQTPKPILEYLKKNISKGTHYVSSFGRADLRKAIARKLNRSNKIKHVSAENIIVSTGSQEALFAGLLATIDPSEQVILQNPGYLGYLPAIELVTGHPVYLPLQEEENFEINPDVLNKLINKKTRALILNSPSNPTGNVLSRRVLEEIADIVIENDIYVFSDEAYEKLVYDKKHISIGSLNGLEKNVITLQTFSKSYAMTGFRVGYAAGPVDLIKAMAKAKEYVSLCAPHPSQIAALKALTLPSIYVEKMRLEYKKRRKYMLKRLNELALPTREPHGAFYAFPSIKHLKLKSKTFSDLLLKQHKVAVIPGTEFGSNGEGFIRLSYATSMPNIKKAMDRIAKFARKFR
jgi:aminotransferase